nr:Chain A, ARGININE REPRESSOR [Geobacillus stearothermophilus]1B4B_B Chain B, ARGININE REPRESSOR [Geobacillus stearothermophilus]1B4B_C Chain C, ARGININE REPRESSOR [Geobacillus stearothermophilus]
ALVDVFIKLDGTGNLLVLRTLPGNAHAIGVLLDNLDWDEIVGTICGDDTCLIICRTPKDAKKVSNQLLSML